MSFRSQQAELFATDAVVERVVGEGEFDETTGEVDPDEVEVIYDGPCIIRPMKRREGSDVTTGEREVRFLDVEAKFPVDTPILKDDLVTVTASEHDPALVGVVFRITDVPLDEWQISRRAVLEQTTGLTAEEES